MGIRVGFYLLGLCGGGTEGVMINLASGIAEQDYSMGLVLLQAKEPLLVEISGSVRLIDLNARHSRGERTVANFIPLLRYLLQERPKALLSAIHANIMPIWARRLTGIPPRVVISEHSYN